MTVTASYNVTSVKGAQTNLESVLKTVSPHETPLFATLSQSAAPKATLNEWLVDSLASPEIGGVIDGVDLTISDAQNLIDTRARLGNRVQTIRDIFSVSRQAEMIGVAPGGSLFAASKAKSLIQLKNSIETAIGSGNDQSAGTSSAGAKMCGLGIWSDPSATGNTFDRVAQAGLPCREWLPCFARQLDRIRFPWTSSRGIHRRRLQGTYNLFAAPAVMNQITDYTRSTTANGNFSFDQDVSGKTLVRSILTYVSDYSTINIIPDLFLRRVDGSASGTDTVEGTVNTDRAYLIPDDDTVSIKFLRGITVQDLPDNGAGKRAFSEAMLTLRVSNPRALGSIV